LEVVDGHNKPVSQNGAPGGRGFGREFRAIA
jgi:hypothetical protein